MKAAWQAICNPILDALIESYACCVLLFYQY